MSVAPPYQVRFIRAVDAAELVNLYHLARVPLSNSEHPLRKAGYTDRHARTIVASRWFHQEHPEVSELGAYKDLEGLLAWV